MLIHVSLHPVALKGVVPTNYPATTEPHGLRRPKSTNALMARSRSKRQRHDPPRLLRARRQVARLPRRRAWLRIFVVRCSLPCDPPVGGHSCNGGIIPPFHRGVCTDAIGKSGECFTNNRCGSDYSTTSSILSLAC